MEHRDDGQSLQEPSSGGLRKPSTMRRVVRKQTKSVLMDGTLCVIKQVTLLAFDVRNVIPQKRFIWRAEELDNAQFREYPLGGGAHNRNLCRDGNPISAST